MAANMSLMGSKKNASSCLVAIGVVLVVLGSAYVQQTDAASLVGVINLSSVPINVSVTVNGSSVGSVLAGAGLNVSLSLNVSLPVTVNLTVINLRTGATVTILNVSLNITSAIVITPALLPAPPPPPASAASPPPPLPGLPGVPPLPGVPLINAVNVLLVNVVNDFFDIVRILALFL